MRKITINNPDETFPKLIMTTEEYQKLLNDFRSCKEKKRSPFGIYEIEGGEISINLDSVFVIKSEEYNP